MCPPPPSFSMINEASMFPKLLELIPTVSLSNHPIAKDISTLSNVSNVEAILARNSLSYKVASLTHIA